MNRIKRFAAALALLVLIASSLIMPTAKAHYLESDNGVSAIIHIKPDDQPVAGKAVPINFLFSSEAGGFTLNDYAVELKLSKDKAVVVTKPLDAAFFGASREGEVRVTFPTAGAYEVTLVGTPKTADEPAFTLNYETRVADSTTVAARKGNGSAVAILSGFSLLIVAMVAAKQIRSGGKYQVKQKR